MTDVGERVSEKIIKKEKKHAYVKCNSPMFSLKLERAKRALWTTHSL